MPSWPKSTFLFIPCVLLVILCIIAFDHHIGQVFLSLYDPMLRLLLPEAWSITTLQIAREGREAFVSIHVTTQAPFYLMGQLIPTGITMTGSTLLGHAIQPLLIILVTLLGWLFLAQNRRLSPVCFALLLLFMVEAVDVPVVLAGSLWDVLYSNYAIGSPLPWEAKAMNLLNSGGRQALSVAAAIAAIVLGHQPLHRIGRQLGRP